MTRRMAGSSAYRIVRMCSLAAALLLCALAAQAQPSKPWAVVYTAGQQQPEAEIRRQLMDVSAVLQSRGIEVVDDMAEPFERLQSQAVSKTSSEQLEHMRQLVDAIARQLAMGELNEALRDMREFEQQPIAARDDFNRDRAQAKRVFSECVTTAYLLQGSGREREANDRMQRCASRFPGFELAPSEFSESMRQLFEQATAAAGEPVWLRVESRQSDTPCTVRVNGVDMGRAPLRMRTRAGVVRIHLECGDDQRASRVHPCELVAGENAIFVDPALDQAVSVTRPWVYLRYHDRDGLGPALGHAVEVGKALGAGDVVQVLGGSPVRLRRIDLRTGIVTAQSEWSGSVSELTQSVDVLLKRATISSSTHPAGEQSANGAAGRGRATETGWFHLTAADPGLFAITGGLWIASAATVAVILSQRSSLRAEGGALSEAAGPLGSDESDAQLRGLTDDYNAKGWAALLLSGSSNALAITSAVLTLPRLERSPPWAWALGGLGAAMAVSGFAIWVAAQHCAITDPAGKCQAWSRDPLLGPLLLLNASAPLSVGLTYLLGRTMRSDVNVSLQAEPGASMLRVRGSF